MKQKNKRFNSKLYKVAFLLLVVITAVSTLVVIRHNHIEASPSTTPQTSAVTTSLFKFAGTTDWWQGATNRTSMAVFHDSHDCFISIESKPGTVNAAAELQKAQSVLTDGGYKVTAGNTQILALQTKSGPRQYELQQSSVITPAGANKAEGGQEFGYLQLSGNYLKIMGYCDTADELPATIPALQAIRYTD